MRHRFLASMGAFAIVIAVAWLTPIRAVGQTPAPKKTASKAAPASRTPWGHPDLQGVWDFRTVTPLERPTELAGKQVLTDEEAADFEKKSLESRNADSNRRTATRRVVNGTNETEDVALAYNEFWWDRGTKVIGSKRTSLIVDPPDGRIPALTPEAQKRADATAAARERPAVGPEDRSVGERCIMGFNAGPPISPGGYNQNVHLFQTPDHVVILNEMVHNARIVPLDGRPHGKLRQWSGDSRGHWEGNTLVVDTINFYDQTSLNNSSPNMHVVERFTRVDADSLLYEFTVEDPTTWTKAWTAQLPMIKTEAPLYEYACHEGNYGMFGLLSGARAIEKAREEAAKKGSK